MICWAQERDPQLAGLKPARLSGIRELYLTLTGDVDMHGGYYPERARLATTADFSGLVKNSLNKVVIANRWKELGEAGYNWWQRVASVEHFDSLQQVTGTLVGTVGDLPEVAERGEYQELVVGDSPETADWKKYGGYIPLTPGIDRPRRNPQAESLPARTGGSRPAQDLQPGFGCVHRQQRHRT